MRAAKNRRATPMQYGMAAYAIVRDSEAEARKELERITALPPKPPKGFDNFDQWLSGTQLERELKLQEYSVSNRGLRPNFVGTPEQVRERIGEYEAAGLDLLLLQMSPQAEEMDRFAEQVIAPMKAHSEERRMAREVRNNEAEQQYELEVEGRLALAAYRLRDGRITFTHTEVPEALEGQGDRLEAGQGGARRRARAGAQGGARLRLREALYREARRGAGPAGLTSSQILPAIARGGGPGEALVEGFFQTAKNPSTALRAVPLPGKGRGGIWEDQNEDRTPITTLFVSGSSPSSRVSRLVRPRSRDQLRPT
jgi:hypothetical protein